MHKRGGGRCGSTKPSEHTAPPCQNLSLCEGQFASELQGILARQSACLQSAGDKAVQVTLALLRVIHSDDALRRGGEVEAHAQASTWREKVSALGPSTSYCHPSRSRSMPTHASVLAARSGGDATIRGRDEQAVVGDPLDASRV